MKKKFTIQDVIHGCSIILLSMIFISKISFKSLRVVPYSLPPVIFQHGLHPYINFGIQFIVSLVLIFLWIKTKNKQPLSLIYRLYIWSMLVLLCIQTLFQMTLINVNKSMLIQLAGLGMAGQLVIVYGIVIPQLFPLKKFIYYTTKISVFLVLISFVGLPLLYMDMFKGGRFVGFFKHIPHMVTASTVAFIFFLPTLFSEHKWTIQKNIPVKIFIAIILMLSVLLTSTKAAIGTIAITALVGTMIFGSRKRSIRLFKFAALSTLLVSTLLIGAPTGEFVYEVTTGKTGLGLRKAQDGVSTRMEEVTRGWSMFEQSPYFGLGLLYKFLNNKEDGIEVETYNSFKDPHNLFVSAAVIGGYPLFVYAIMGYLLMVAATIKGLRQFDPVKKLMGLFLLSHLPVFVIYHAHFSLGGMADRLYWLVFGYLGQEWSRDQINTTALLKSN